MITIDHPMTADELLVLNAAWRAAQDIAAAAALNLLTLYTDRGNYRIYHNAAGRWALANEHGFWPLHEQGR